MGGSSKVKASKTVSFKSSCTSSGESIIVEADKDLNVDSSGDEKSSFTFGDNYYFRVYKTAGISGYKTAVSDGTLTTVGTQQSVTQEETIKFENTNTAEVSYPINSINSITWWGTSPGTIKKSGDMEVSSESEGVAVGRLSYESTYDSYSISISQPANYDSESDEGYEVLIYVEESVS